jgi:hypothetical protein
VPVRSGSRLRPKETDSTEKASLSLASPAMPMPSALSRAVGKTLKEIGPSIRVWRPVAASMREASSARIDSAERKRGRAASAMPTKAKKATTAMMSFFSFFPPRPTPYRRPKRRSMSASFNSM